MNNSDDWGTPSNEWENGDTSNSQFKWEEPSDHFGPQQQLSAVEKFSRKPIWVKLIAGSVIVTFIGFIFIQMGIKTQIQSLGFFRETVSPTAACLNTGQVLTELAVGTFSSQILMDKAIEHADALKSQTSGDPEIDGVMWSVANAAQMTQMALHSLRDSLDFGEVLSGDVLLQLNSPEAQQANASVQSAVVDLSKACQTVINLDTPNGGDNLSAEEDDSSTSSNLLDTPASVDERPAESADLVPEADLSGEMNLNEIQSSTFRVDCEADEVMGSAFAADLSSLTGLVTDERLIVTNHHVIEGCIRNGNVIISQGDIEAPARIVSFDETFDIAILRTDGFQQVKALRPNFLYQVGDEVITSGHPDGIKTAITFGRVTLFDEEDYLIYSDALAGPGSSGGPMLNANGEVIGIVTFILEETRGMSLASPIDSVCFNLFKCIE